MAAMGFCEEYLRLPLTKIGDGHRAQLMEEMRRMGVIA